VGYISDEKLYAPFNRVNTLELEYVQQAKELAIKIAAGEEVTTEELAAVRNGAIADRKNLKGDFVISCFLDMMQFNRWEGGKRIRISDKEIAAIYRNEIEGGSITKFCKENNQITRTKHYRIKKMDVKDAESKERLEAIKRQVVAEFEKEQQKL